MKIIRNRFIPFKGFVAMNLFGVIFVRNEAHVSNVVLNHESIHTAQMKELLYVPFYVWYILEYLVKLVIYRNSKEAYRNISFEREAYDNEYNLNYLGVRIKYDWINRVKK